MTYQLVERHERFGVLWLLGLYTGLRVSDLLKIQVKDIKQLLRVRESKTGKVREFDVPSEMRTALRRYIKDFELEQDDYLIFSRMTCKNKPMSRQWAHAIIARTSTQMGLFSIGAHSMRKTYACEKYRQIRSVEAVNRIMGHKHLSTTLLYLRDELEQRD
jgi:integrase